MSKSIQALSYHQRIPHCQNPTAQTLLKIVEDKQTNLSLSVDVTHKDEVLKLAELLGPKICVLKTHVDIIEDFDQHFTEALKRVAQKHHFLIFEDRKFADIGNTVRLQYEKGIYKISDWASITNAHSVPGEGIIEGLKKGGLKKGNALLLLAEMSSKGNLARGEYTQKTIEMAQAHKDFVIGFITRRKLLEDPAFINFTPGVQLIEGKDALGQQYITPEQALIEFQTDIIIVGRGIYEAAQPVVVAEEYRSKAWDAYQQRLKD